jgi:hypothetical protein
MLAVSASGARAVGGATLNSVTQSNRLITAQWTLPSDEYAYDLWTSPSPTVDGDGAFTDLYGYWELGPFDIQVASSTQLPPGTWYFQVITVDDYFDPTIGWASNVLSANLPADPPPAPPTQTYAPPTYTPPTYTPYTPPPAVKKKAKKKKAKCKHGYKRIGKKKRCKKRKRKRSRAVSSTLRIVG